MLGSLSSGNTLLVYVSWLMVILIFIMIYRTPLGFWMRAAGENPEALGMRVQSLNVSSNLTSLAPYLATVVMMVWVVRRKERRQRGLGKLGQ